jgi:hypothetical protein
MSGVTPQQRTRDNLTARGYLVGSVERRKKFPDRKKSPCKACGHQAMIEISSDLWEVFDIIAVNPAQRQLWVDDSYGHGGGNVLVPDIVFVQTTSRNNHSTRRNKILASMEAKLVLMSGARILIQSWKQDAETRRWQPADEWITLDQFKQAPHYPNTVAELLEIRRREKRPDLPPGTTLKFNPINDSEVPF